MKNALVILVFFLTLQLYGQKTLDTIKVYNIHCTYTDENSIIGWGGNWTEFYPTEECPENLRSNYIENQKMVSAYMDQKKFFWMKLYNTKDQLIYEGLKYSDCRIGKFICYWPNGKIRITGEYNGYSYSTKNRYRLKNCSGKKTGSWFYYDENGNQIDLKQY